MKKLLIVSSALGVAWWLLAPRQQPNIILDPQQDIPHNYVPGVPISNTENNNPPVYEQATTITNVSTSHTLLDQLLDTNTPNMGRNGVSGGL